MPDETFHQSPPLGGDTEHSRHESTQSSPILCSSVHDYVYPVNDVNQSWLEELKIPFDPGSWEDLAKERYHPKIPSTSDASDTTKPSPSLFAGRRVFDIPLRELDNWASGSGIQETHYLVSRILWKEVSWKHIDSQAWEKPEESWLELSKHARRESESYLKGYKAWAVYLDDIKTWQDRIAHPQNMRLGAFAPIRTEQLSNREVKNQDMSPKNFAEHDGVARHTRSTTRARGEAEDSKRRKTTHEPNQPTSNDAEPSPRLPDHADFAVPAPERASRHTTESSSQSGGFTGQLHGHQMTEMALPPNPKFTNYEDTVNASLVYLLIALCLRYSGMRLHWKMDKPQWTVHLGKAKIVAKPDGGLMDIFGDYQHPHIIIEVKAGVLSHPGTAPSTLRQMGIELLCWIYRCHHDGEPKKRYVMFSQHCREIFIIVARVRPEYIRFLDGEVQPGDEFQNQFLELQLFGPFNIFNAADMALFGRIAVCLTIQQQLDLPVPRISG